MKFHFRSYDHGGMGGGVIVPTDHPSSLLIIDAHGHGGGGGDFRIADNDHHHGEYGGGEENYGLDASLHKGRPSLSAPAAAAATTTTVGHHTPARSTMDNNDGSSPPWHASPTPSNAAGHGTDSSASGSPSGSPTSKRALHLDHHECECPISNPDPHSRPRSRQFFRLGRNRYKPSSESRDAACGNSSCSGSEEDEDGRSSLRGEHRGAVVQRSSTVSGSVVTSRRSGIRGLRKMRRAQSLPTDLGKVKNKSVTSNNGGGSTSTSAGPMSNDADGVSSSEYISSRPRAHTCTHRRHVTFTSVSIREYSTILGDHPCCPSGPPLSLGWTLEREDSMEFELYEKEREPVRVRCTDEMRLGGDVRRDILRSLVRKVATSSTPGSNGHGDERSGEEGSSDNDEPKTATQQCGTAVYSQQELRRAERRLTRDRAGLNSRAHRRINRGFFRPLTPKECEIGDNACCIVMAAQEQVDAMESAEEEVGLPMKEVESGSGVASVANAIMEDNHGGSSRMDISPVKSPTTVAMQG